MSRCMFIVIALLLVACGTTAPAQQASSPVPYPAASATATPPASSAAYPGAPTTAPYPVQMSTAEQTMVVLQGTATALADPALPTWTPAVITPSPTLGPPGSTPTPAGSDWVPPTTYPYTPTPAASLDDFTLMLVAQPQQGVAPLTVTFQLTLNGGADDRYEFYCTYPLVAFGVGEERIEPVTPLCEGWTPDAGIRRVYDVEYTYERPGIYLVEMQLGGLTSSVPVFVR